MTARPFLKWVGGKRQLLPVLRERMPATFGRYFEPFMGGAALFFDVRPARAVLGDANERLVRTYRAVRDDVEGVIEALGAYRYDAEVYAAARDVDVDALSDVGVAAWFIYVHKTGFNGLYRVNRAGKFNVPFGRYTNPTICDAENLRACSAALRGVELRIGDFAETCAGAMAGDFVYFDPPYVPLSATSSFTAYAAAGFGADAQTRLRDTAAALLDRGVHILLSNSSAGLVRELYGVRPFDVTEVDATRSVNCQASKRGAIKELVIGCRP